jgi:hypothetical protein
MYLGSKPRHGMPDSTFLCILAEVLCRIQAVLARHIQKQLPELRTEIATMQREKAAELASLGRSPADGSDDCCLRLCYSN